MKKLFFNLYRVFSILLLALLITATHHVEAAEVSDEDENWHNLSQVNRLAYEWLYFDIHSDDGNSLVVAYLAPNPFDADMHSFFTGIKKHVGMSIQAVTPDKKSWDTLEFTQSGDATFSADPYRLKLNNSVLEMKKNAAGMRVYRLLIDSVDSKTGMAVRGELEFEATMKGWMHKDGKLYSNNKAGKKEKMHRWFVPAPRGQVTGWYQFIEPNGQTSGVIHVKKASGYHDHNLGTLPITATTDGWYWGRAEVGDKVVIYSKIFGKSQQAFSSDIRGLTYFQNPASTVMYIGTNQKVLVDSSEMQFDDGGLQNMVVLENGMLAPNGYKMSVKGLSGETWVVKVTITHDLNLRLPHYSRQTGIMEIQCFPEVSPVVKTLDCDNSSSEKVIIEQFDFVRYAQIVLGLPMPINGRTNAFE